MIRTVGRRALTWGVVVLLAAPACTVDDAFLDGMACGPGDSCAGGFLCVREACPGNPGYLCPVCRSEAPSDAGVTDGTDGGDAVPEDGDWQQGDSPECSGTPPACKTLPDCQDTQAACEGGAWQCATRYEPVETSCDGQDNDCDGETDRDLVCVLAGSGVPGLIDDTGRAAAFREPRGLAPHPQGGILVADQGNHVVRWVRADGSTTTLAGSGSYGHEDGDPRTARFHEPSGVAVQPDGALIVADRLNHRIRRVGDNGAGVDEVSTLAGNGFADYLDGPAADARFAMPTAVAILADGTIVVADSGNHCLRAILADQVTTYSGSCEHPGFQDGTASEARFNLPTDLVRMEDGTLVVAEESSHALRLVSPDGSVVTIAGTGGAGFAEGTPLEAQFRKPAGMVVESGSLLLVADSGNHRIRSVSIGVEVATRLGSGEAGAQDGPPLQASFRQPRALAYLEDGRLVIADTLNHMLRVLQP